MNDAEEPSALATRPTNMIEMAIQRGMDAAGIAQLVELARQERRDLAERAYTDAIRSVTAQAGVILKSKKGSKSNYAPLDEINYVLTPLYTKAGLSLSFSEADCPLEGWKRHVCDIRHNDGHKERYHLDMPLDNADGNNKGMTPIQGAISSGSYCQRVLICRIFNLTIALTDLDGANGNETITEGEQAEIKGLIEQLEELTGKTHFGPFLKWLAAPSIAEITGQQYKKGIAELNRAIAKAKKGSK